MNKLTTIALALFATFSAHAYHPGEKPIDWKKATAQATSTKGCKRVGKIENVSVQRFEKEIVLQVTTDKDGGEHNLVGPLKVEPTEAQLKALEGRKACAD